LQAQRLVTVLLLTLLAHAGVAGQARSRRRVPAPASESVVGIEAIDFENYTYTLEGGSYKLIGGYYARGAAPEAQWELRVTEAPYYGDLTGDGKNEAVVVLSHGPVGGPRTVEARVYTLRNGRPAQLSTFAIADALSCELDHYADLDDGKVRIESVHGSGGRCEHNEVREYRWDGSKFMPVGDTKTMPCRCM
jgi:hypothetical protein